MKLPSIIVQEQETDAVFAPLLSLSNILLKVKSKSGRKKKKENKKKRIFSDRWI